MKSVSRDSVGRNGRASQVSDSTIETVESKQDEEVGLALIVMFFKTLDRWDRDAKDKAKAM